MKHSQVPFPQVAGKLGLLNGLDVVEGFPEEGIGIQARDHVVQGFRLLYGHGKESEELRAGVVMFLILIGLEGGNGAIQDVQAQFVEKVHTGKSF